MKKFNWETAWGSPQRVLWLKANHNKPLSYEEYAAAHKELRKYSTAKRWRKHGRKTYMPSKMRRQYKYLKETFGFFKG